MVSSAPVCRHFGSLLTVAFVIYAGLGLPLPYEPTDGGGDLAPGGSSINGMNLSGKPGMVQPMQMPPTLGQPPIPAIQPRLGTLQFTTGPQQPSFTRHLGEPYSVREVALFVVAGAVAAFMNRLAEEPRGPQLVIERDHRRRPAT